MIRPTQVDVRWGMQHSDAGFVGGKMKYEQGHPKNGDCNDVGLGNSTNTPAVTKLDCSMCLCLPEPNSTKQK